MYRQLLLTLALLAPSSAIAQSTLLAGWDFQTTTNGGTAISTGTSTQSILYANFGTQVGLAAIYLNGTNGSSEWIPGSSSPGQFTSVNGSAVNAGTGFSTITSGGAAALSLRSQSANDYSITIALSLTGYSDLNLSFATQRSATGGFRSNQWSWSTDGESFTDWGSPIDPATSFATVTLTSLSSVNNASSVFLRYTVDGATSATGSTHLDNIQLTATAIPEPSTYAAIFGSVALAGALVYRRRCTRCARQIA